MRLHRLRQLTAAELRWRIGEGRRTLSEWSAAESGRSRWDRRHLPRVLAATVLDSGLRGAIRAGQWDDVSAALVATLTRRPSRYVLDFRESAPLRRTVLTQWPHAAADAAEHADRMLDGRYDLLGYRDLAFRDRDGAIQWHLDPVHGRRAPLTFWARVPYLDPAIGDHKVIWEFNRHQHWMQFGRAFWLTRDRKYADAIVTELESWLRANPPMIGINWASMLEVAFRSLSWTWALHCLVGEREDGNGERGTGSGWVIDLLIGLDRHLTHVERHLSYYFSPNTHLTGEALALYVVGTALPELAGSARWMDTGRRILLREIDRQIHADGGHAERSTHYQRYMLDFYLLAFLTARRAGDQHAARSFADAALRLAEFTRTIADSSGVLPLIGDDDGGMLWPLAGRSCRDVRDSLSLAGAVFERPDLAPWGPTEEAVWIGGAARPCVEAIHSWPEPSSRLLPDTGYFVARDDRGNHAVLDAGRHGYMNGGHAHADALSVTLSIEGRPLLIDPGTSTYTMDPRLRDRMRSTASHNTVTLDGRSQSTPAGPFHWQTQTHAILHEHRHADAFDWVEAAHAAYAPVEHRRTLVRTADDGWLFVDEIRGGGAHSAAAHWHFDPAWTVERDGPRALRATHADGTIVWLLHEGPDVALFHGDERSGLGWHAPVYGTLMPTWTARITRKSPAPFSMVTWIGTSARVPSMTRVVSNDATGDNAIGIRVDHDDRSTVFLLRPGTGTAPTLLNAALSGTELPLARA
jgi:hypothetical protein